MTQRKPILATRLSPIVNKRVKQLAKALGITVSEYLRKLILVDLETKQLFSEKIRETVEQTQINNHERTPEESIRKLLRNDLR